MWAVDEAERKAGEAFKGRLQAVGEDPKAALNAMDG